jgi:hypothetical protein
MWEKKTPTNCPAVADTGGINSNCAYVGMSDFTALPGTNALGRALLLKEGAGAVAALGNSERAFLGPEETFQHALSVSLAGGRFRTIGELFAACQGSLLGTQCNRMLMGDPPMAIAN